MINKFLSKFLRTRLKSQIFYNPEQETLHYLKKSASLKTDYYDENFVNVRSIVDAIHERYRDIRPLHFLVVGQMQSGKTNNMKCFLETACGNIPLDSRLFTCGDGDRTIFDQNLFRLNKHIHVKSLVKFNRDLRKGKESLTDIKLLILDEDQFAQGENSQVHILLKKLYDNYPELIVLRITGTPGGMSSYGFKTIKMKPGPGYVGPSEFLKRGQIKDIRQCYLQGGLFYGKKDPYFFTDTSLPGVTSIHIKDHLKEELTRLVNLNGYGCMRYQHPNIAKREISSYAKSMGWDLEIVIAHQNHIKSGHNKTISAALHEAWTLSITHGKTVLVIFENALKAGFDFDADTPPECKPIKERLVFFYELTDSNWNSHLQGGPGRCSGYHNNTNVHIYANTELVELYSNWESGKISHTELDLKIAEVERAKSPGSPVNAATHVKSVKNNHRLQTWMTAFELATDHETQLLNMRKQLAKIGDGFDPEPLIELLDAYKKDNQLGFSNREVRVAVKTSHVSYNGKDYFMNGKVWSNYANPEAKLAPDLTDIINTGRIHRETIKDHKDKQAWINVGIFVYDDPNLPEPVFYLSLLNGDIDLPKKEFSLIDKTFYTDKSLSDKF